MIVVGVDPGANETGIAVVETPSGRLIESTTIRRADLAAGREVLKPEPSYLQAVCAALLHPLSYHALPEAAGLLAIEGVERPNWHHGGKVKPIDPSHIIATGIVFGSLLGRSWPCPLVVIPPGRNGGQPFATYPDALVSAAERRAPNWRGHMAGDGRLRHERSAYDVARRGQAMHAFARAQGSVYA